MYSRWCLRLGVFALVVARRTGPGEQRHPAPEIVALPLADDQLHAAVLGAPVPRVVTGNRLGFARA